MRKTYLALILIFIFSCSQQDNRIMKFEKILGKEQSEALNLLVADFDKNLNKNYPNLSTEKGYRQYLKDILSESTTGMEKFEFQSDQTNSKFHKSGLWNEIYEYRYSYSLDGKDSTKTLNSKNLGKYMLALYSIKDTDSFISEYCAKRESAGLMQNELVVEGILSLNPDFTDYFHKRIVVIEFSY